MRVVFMGTPEFAVTVLESLLSIHEVVAVISQPDRAKDRSGKFVFTPVKAYALGKGIPVYQFEKIRDHADELKSLNADIFVTAAYGQILSKEIIDIPKFGIVNVHASLLPKYRGSSPIQTAILNGDEETGVTIMQTAATMDTGDILLAREVKISDMNAGQLSETLALLGGSLLLEALDGLQKGVITPTKQDDSISSGCRKILKEAAEIDFTKSAREVYNMIRAFNPSPVAYSFYRGERIKFYETECVQVAGAPGEIVGADKSGGIIVACGKGALRIKKLQFPGKKVMSAIEIINGNKLTVGEYFGK